MGGLVADIFVECIFRISFHAANLLRSRRWPIVKATELTADCPNASYGCTVATVYYEYVVNGEKYGDAFGKRFILHESGENYAAQFVKGTEFKIRVKLHMPTKPVPLWDSPSMV